MLALLIAWSYVHKLYEPGSALARNFLLIAPNIIVLVRLRADFDGLRIFFNDPILLGNGHEGRNWRDDFQITLHIQDDVRVVRDTGNLFLTNIHRVFLSDVPEPSLNDEDLRDYLLSPFGARPSGKTTDSKTDLGELVREIDELSVFNDEAHHIHDPRMAWFKRIQDIHLRMLQKDRCLALQVDVTATPRHNNGAIFVQTVADYPLVEAIHQNVVKHPVLPDAASRARLHEVKSAIITEKYVDFLQVGVEEWRKSYAEHEQLGKKAVLFVMVDAINRSALIGSDHVIIPLAADLFSPQGLHNLGPTLRGWRQEWRKRLDNWPNPSFPLPDGNMGPAGYIVQQHMERLSRPVRAYERWAARIPRPYQERVLSENADPVTFEADPHCLARLKHYRSLVPMAQEARKPIFSLTAVDGAIGNHSYAVSEARKQFHALAETVLERIGMPVN